MLEPEPRSKRTVEGDLGVFINAANIVRLSGDTAWQARLSDLQALPVTEQQVQLTRWLCQQAVETAVRRHAGTVSDLYTPTGKRQVVKGKDLSAVQWVIGTGGALTRLPGGEEILRSLARKQANTCCPRRCPHPDRPGLPLLCPWQPGPGLPRRNKSHLPASGWKQKKPVERTGTGPSMCKQTPRLEILSPANRGQCPPGNRALSAAGRPGRLRHQGVAGSSSRPASAGIRWSRPVCRFAPA